MNDAEQSPPRTGYWHLWTDADGVSHQTRCELTDFQLAQVGAAAPQWNDHQPRGEATVVFTVQPVGWVGDWHENPAPQWIVPLSGRWWWKPWTARASRWARASCRSARINIAWPIARVARDIVPARSENSLRT